MKTRIDGSSTLRRWRAVSYVRLSREDRLQGESESIASQRELIAGWAAQQPDVQMLGEYADDGYSGATFDRPGFAQMIADARQGLFDTIVVKDLSRFGRSYLDCGNWIERDLPQLGVRLYSICDDFDSMQKWDYDMALLLPMKNLMNEMMVINTSQKVRASLAAKRARGEYVANFAPFGYAKDPCDRHRLVVDPPAAVVVRRIFHMRAEGKSATEIARMLNAEGVASPAVYRAAMKAGGHMTVSEQDAGRRSLWYAKSVQRILDNEAYTGSLVQGKTRRISWRMRTNLPVPAEERIRHAHTHEPLIARDLFDLVTQISRERRKAIVRHAGKPSDGGVTGWRLICADCESAMQRITVHVKGKTYVYWVCSAHRHNARICSTHCVREESLWEQIDSLQRTHNSGSGIFAVNTDGVVIYVPIMGHVEEIDNS